MRREQKLTRQMAEAKQNKRRKRSNGDGMSKGGNKNGGKYGKGKRPKKVMGMWFHGGLVHGLVL